MSNSAWYEQHFDGFGLRRQGQHETPVRCPHCGGRVYWPCRACLARGVIDKRGVKADSETSDVA